ncbi:MAG: PIG-L family deacetylase [Chloroflexi bacterium]|nr:PIG-L family deacetylase [Chloroflexota bacterium]
MPKSGRRNTKTGSPAREQQQTPGGGPGPRRVILGVFAHPDDETSGAGGTFTRYAREGVEIVVATATRGEQGHLGTGDSKIRRAELPQVRERELRQVLQSYGARPPVFLGYRDQEVKDADFAELTGKVHRVMMDTRPDVVITFGPRGISDHDDHVTVHRAAVEAFHRYRESVSGARLYYVAIPKAFVEEVGMDLDGPEVDPHVLVDIAGTLAVKVQALRTYSSQQDAQQLADMFEQRAPAFEGFHQAYPPWTVERTVAGFWED